MTQHIYEWCSIVIPLLKAHIQLFADHTAQKAEAQNQILQKVLRNGVAKMGLVQTDVEKMSKKFNTASETLIKLVQQFAVEFEKKHKRYIAILNNTKLKKKERNKAGDKLKRLMTVTNFYLNLGDQIRQASMTLNNIAAPLKDLIRDSEQQLALSEKQVDFNTIADDAAPHDDLVKAIENLITKCSEYEKRH